MAAFNASRLVCAAIAWITLTMLPMAFVLWFNCSMVSVDSLTVVRISRVVPRQPVMVMADRIRLEQVIINLLRNALDATKDVAVPQIDLLLAMGETATLSVRDNGHGISELDNLFEPFYTTKKPGEGVGLGLAISSGIVTDLGGRLTARNAEGGGAVFEMQLPRLGKEEAAA